MRSRVVKRCFGILFFVLLFFMNNNLFAGNLVREFKSVINAIEQIPYNPRPVATDTADVTLISHEDTRDAFLNTFTRVEISAPANGRTFFESDPINNYPDVTLIAYYRSHPGEGAVTRPWIILTHGGTGDGSITLQGGFLLHIANVLYSNGYNVLGLDRRDGLLSRCGYSYSGPDLVPDPQKSQANFPDGFPTQNCERLPEGFRIEQFLAGFSANSLPCDFQAFSAGDLLAAAQYLKNEMGAQKIGALSGSMGGLNIIRAAFIQEKPDNNFDSGLLDAILAFSPVGDFNTIQYSRGNYDSLPCNIADLAKYYSNQIYGTGIRDFETDPAGATEDFLELMNGVKILPAIKIPVLIIYTLTERNVYPTEGFAYKAQTAKMKLGHTIIMSLLGHFNDTWRSDPYWGDKVVLTYFKGLLGEKDPRLDNHLDFTSLGPNEDNPFLIKWKMENENYKTFLSQRSVVEFFEGVCFPPE